jgi:hypothetical protein
MRSGALTYALTSAAAAAADAYDKFDRRAGGYTTVILHPGQPA